MSSSIRKTLAALVAGLVLVLASALAVQPAMAAGYAVQQPARVSNVAQWDVLNVRAWPAPHSRQVSALGNGTSVWVERCNVIARSADWCLIHRGDISGWVNSRYLTVIPDRHR